MRQRLPIAATVSELLTMLGTAAQCCGAVCLLLVACATELCAQKAPYDVFPPAEPPYYRVRYEASDKPGELIYGVNYTVWIPPGVKTLRGVIVHQHGCGEGSCKSGLTGAYDLHWQALAKKHDCALLSPSYEQPEKADCQMWCDPRNGSDAAFQKCLADLGAKSGHPELAKVPWALWGHSGGGHWAGGMVMLHPDRIAAAWLRSGVPLLKDDPTRKGIKAHTLPDAALKVPLMCNLGTKEGVTVKDKNFAGVWPANEVFFNEVRGKGGLVGVAVDPLSSHDCGNQRYLAIPWLDACLTARLPKAAGDPLVAMPTDKAWLAPPTGSEAVPAAKFTGEPLKAAWLPNEATGEGVDGVRQGHEGVGHHAAARADERARAGQQADVGGRSRPRKRAGELRHRTRRPGPRDRARNRARTRSAARSSRTSSTATRRRNRWCRCSSPTRRRTPPRSTPTA